MGPLKRPSWLQRTKGQLANGPRVHSWRGAAAKTLVIVASCASTPLRLLGRSTLLARLRAGPGSAVFLAVGGAAESLYTKASIEGLLTSVSAVLQLRLLLLLL